MQRLIYLRLSKLGPSEIPWNHILHHLCTPPPSSLLSTLLPPFHLRARSLGTGSALAATLQHKDNTVGLQLHLSVLLSRFTVIISHTVCMNTLTLSHSALNLLLYTEQ